MNKSILIALLLVFTLGNTTFAQTLGEHVPPSERPTSKSVEDRVANQVERLTSALKLSPEQVEQVTNIVSQSAEKMMALRKPGADRKQVREEMKVIRDESDAAIEAVLDKKQLKRYQNYKARREERGPRGGGRPGGRERGPDGGK